MMTLPSQCQTGGSCGQFKYSDAVMGGWIPEQELSCAS